MLAAMRLLNIKGEFIRKRKFDNKSGKTPTNFDTLQESFNLLSGLKTDKSVAFVLNSIKAILSSCVKAHNKGFPGGWINASRALNGVKTDFAVINLLGWVEKVPSQHKLLEVLFNTVDPLEENGLVKGYKLVNITQDKRQFSHREFRTAVALTLPRINIVKGGNPITDLSLDPFSVKDLRICNNFCVDRRDILVDRLNESYGFKVSLKNPKTKTKDIHYKMSRDRLLAESANIPLVTANGLSYDNFSDIPKTYQKFLRDSFRYPIKRVREEELLSEEIIPMEVEPVTGETQASSSKKRKLTKGQAAVATRKSGRLHGQKPKT
jgi:hypothetical protein